MTEKKNKVSERIKDAELISVDLSIQLFSVAIALIGVLGGLFTYLLGMPLTVEHSKLFYFISGVCFFLYVISIICGGKGIHATKKFISGETSKKSERNWFNYQATSGLIALLGTLSLIFFYSESEDIYLPEVKSLNNNISKIVEQNRTMDLLEQRLYKLENQLDSLQAPILHTDKAFQADSNKVSEH